MRSWLSVATITIWILFASTSAWSEPRVAVRGEGFVGYDHVDFGPVDEDAFEGGGGISAALTGDRFYLQGDVLGDSIQYDDIGPFDADLDSDSVVAALHLGWRNPERGALGIAGLYEHLEFETRGAGFLSGSSDSEVWRGGVEGELFLGPVSLAANAGLLQLQDDTTGYVDFGIAFYPTERARVHLGGGVADIEESEPWGLIGAGGELLLLDPLSLFARWDATLVDDDTDYEHHSFVVGARLYWGAETPSLLVYDRSYFKRTCVAPIFVTGRTC
ncbi:MAG: hypothetical protein R3F35_07035 [Myxococcota bacterium]